MKRPGVGVGVFIFRGQKFLMAKRRGAHGSGSWSVPGGWMEFGESFEQTAKREALEEVGLKIKNIKFAAVSNNVFPEENVHSVTIWVTSICGKDKEQILEPDRIEDLLWCDFDSLPRPLFSPWNELLKSDFLGGIKERLKKS